MMNNPVVWNDYERRHLMEQPLLNMNHYQDFNSEHSFDSTVDAAPQNFPSDVYSDVNSAYISGRQGSSSPNSYRGYRSGIRSSHQHSSVSLQSGTGISKKKMTYPIYQTFSKPHVTPVNVEPPTWNTPLYSDLPRRSIARHRYLMCEVPKPSKPRANSAPISPMPSFSSSYQPQPLSFEVYNFGHTPDPHEDLSPQSDTTVEGEDGVAGNEQSMRLSFLNTQQQCNYPPHHSTSFPDTNASLAFTHGNAFTTHSSITPT
ncbi:hypothetical protein BDQ12DRAFT_499679 [Crucibulum laeve]|uniref:Uncharacterized protein n=1 Tax=Crucibulum laeve TaxID=68775 RepID=A0A5C3LIV9_9AGAR|nr:hypothetical protein BDQ12DRAFT_499679 [Crucibulum laeve]